MPASLLGRRLATCLCLALAILTTPVSAGESTGRVALVVGMANYRTKGMEILPKCANDAAEMTTALRGSGFVVTTSIDPDKATLETAITRFATDLAAAGPDGVAAFYYSGHGAAYDGRTLLIPVDCNGVKDTVELDRVLAAMKTAGTRRNLIFLDACRSPIAGLAAGLAEPSNPPPGTLIAYAAAPGRTAPAGPADDRTSPWTGCLLQHVTTNDLPLTEVLTRARQGLIATYGAQHVPWETSSLVQPLVLRSSTQLSERARLYAEAERIMTDEDASPAQRLAVWQRVLAIIPANAFDRSNRDQRMLQQATAEIAKLEELRIRSGSATAAAPNIAQIQSTVASSINKEQEAAARKTAYEEAKRFDAHAESTQAEKTEYWLKTAELYYARRQDLNLVEREVMLDIRKQIRRYGIEIGTEQEMAGDALLKLLSCVYIETVLNAAGNKKAHKIKYRPADKRGTYTLNNSDQTGLTVVVSGVAGRVNYYTGYFLDDGGRWEESCTLNIAYDLSILFKMPGSALEWKGAPIVSVNRTTSDDKDIPRDQVQARIHSAINQWEAYIRLHPNGPQIEHARKHLQFLKNQP